MSDPRPSPIAGRWYPGEAAALRASVQALLAAAQPPVTPPAPAIRALLAPHAGHYYCGAVAAHAYQLVRDLAVEVVIVLSPSHFHEDGYVVTTAHDAYVTPLGTVPVDQPALTALQAQLAKVWKVPPATAVAPIRQDREHAIEIELPFLQLTLQPGWQLWPLMLREYVPFVTEALSDALVQQLAGRRALLVASSDLSHFYQHQIAQKLDATLLEAVATFDPAQIYNVEAAGLGFACGLGAITTAWRAARALGATQAQVLKHATSGDISGDYGQVVGYGAAVAW